MSGRLVILRHKSWNVWNQDNQEKVLRDERLHKEKQDALSLKQKNLLQEQQRESLLSNDVTCTTENKEHDGKRASSINFFEDFEKNDGLKRENDEYRKEREAKDAKRQKQEGVQPWSLSEGVNIKPWYAKAPRIEADTSSSTSIQQQPKKSKTHEWAKHNLDPMSKYISVQKEAIGKEDSIVSATNTKQLLSNSSTPCSGDDLLTKLRKKRIEREKLERHKASVMLAEIDIGASRNETGMKYSESMNNKTYHQQYNPKVSRI